MSYPKILLLLFWLVSSTGFAQKSADHRLPLIEAEIFSIDRSHSSLEFSIEYPIDDENVFSDQMLFLL